MGLFSRAEPKSSIRTVTVCGKDPSTWYSVYGATIALALELQADRKF